MKTAYLSSYLSHKLWDLVYVCIFCNKGKIVGTRTFSNVFGVMSFDFFSTMIKR